MKYRSFLTVFISFLLIVLTASSCLADSYLQSDTEGNISMTSPDEPGGSSDLEFADSSDTESGGSSVGESSISGTTEAIQYKTEYDEMYSFLQTGSPYPTNHLCMILIPEEIDQEEFVEFTEWDLYSSFYGFDIVLLDCDWKKKEANSYFESVYEEVQEREEEDLQIYLIGYEDGADFAALEAANHTDRYSGLVTLGGSGIGEEQLKELKRREDRPALSVWIIAPAKDQEVTENLKYWRTVNSITGSSQRAYQLRFADELYLPPVSTVGSIDSDSDRMGIVLYSRKNDYYDFTLSGSIARNFVSEIEKDRACFRSGITGGEIISINDMHFTYNRIQMSGQQRDYWIYTPDAAYLGTEPSTLILCLHGKAGTGEDMIFQTQWHEIAAENNCIIVYPSSLYKTGTQHDWVNTPEELSFFRRLVETICSRFQVDSSRIYVTGFSNGCCMSQNLAIRCSDIFAAAALSAPVYWEKENYGPVSDPHEVALLYSLGTEDEFLYAYDMTAEIDGTPATRKLQYWEMMYGFEHDSYECYPEGMFTVYTYRSPNHIPVCHWIKVEGKHHMYPAEEVPVYYEFLRHYTKGPDGKLYYDGRLVESNLTYGATWDYYQGEQY